MSVTDDFVPASVDPNKTSAVDFGQNGKVTVTMPNLEGSGTTESVYQGQRKPHQKECVLIIDNETGDMILEKLNTSMIVKKARLRQEDLTGKSLALNNKTATVNGGGPSLATGSTNSLSQAKSSLNDKKATSSSLGVSGLLKSGPNVPNAANKFQKQSPPLASANVSNSNSAPARTNGFQPKTPSPPSMPIFLANKGLIRSTNGSSNATGTEVSGSDWNGLSKAKPEPVIDAVKPSSNRNKPDSKANRRLSEESSSDSSNGGNSDEESSSSQSSDSSSEDEEMHSEKPPVAANSRSSKLSMPSFSMPRVSMPTLTGLSADPMSTVPPSNSAANNVKSPPLLAATTITNDLNSSALSLSLSEDSDSSDDEDQSHRKQSKLSNGNDFAKVIGTSNGKMEQVQKGSSVFVPESNSKPFPMDSMPKFSNGTSSAPTFPSMPKYSQLSKFCPTICYIALLILSPPLGQDLQLSESGSDSDD